MADPATEVFCRVEGNLLPVDAARQGAFLVANAQGLRERFVRCITFALSASFLPFVRAANPVVGMRALYASLRGLSRDRLEFLGEEYVERDLVKRLNPVRVERLKARLAAGEPVVLVSCWLDHIVRPLARHLGVERVLCNRLEFRDRRATGRLLDPVVTARGAPEPLKASVQSSARPRGGNGRSIVVFDPAHGVAKPLSVRETLNGRQFLLIGVTGFIGKVWLANFLHDVPGIEKVHLLVRRRGRRDAKARFERAMRESPVLQSIDPVLLRSRVEVVEGDTSQPDLGLDEDSRRRLQKSVDVIINSGGLTEFNPDLRGALSANVDSTVHAIEFLRGCDHASLLHLSTVYVAGRRDGRIPEEIEPDYNPARVPGFDAERERQELHWIIGEAEREALAGDVVVPVRPRSGKRMSKTQLRKAQQRWLGKHLARVGTDRAQRYGWPNTYTFTKSLAESQIERLGKDLPIAVVRPSIVESTSQRPFRGWNEGVNTSAPLSHLLSTLFRQVPIKKEMRLDVIPADLVTRGMTLIAAALVRGCHSRCYQLATSVANPCHIDRTIELTALAHRRHYYDRRGLDAWVNRRLESIPVSRRRYQILSAPRQRAFVAALRKVLPFGRRQLRRMERNLERVEMLFELYSPFMYDNDYAFEADKIGLLNAALPPEERETFGYDPASIDWPEYWLDIHTPALRKWSYPLIEGRPIETQEAT